VFDYQSLHPIAVIVVVVAAAVAAS